MIQRNSIIVIGLAIVLAALVGWLNINASEMQPILGTLLFATFLLGALQPKNAWRWALLVCMGVVVSGLLAYFLGITSSGYLHARQINPALPEKESFKAVLQGTISFVPALIGTYSGVLFRKIVETLFVQSPTPQS